MKLNFYKNFKLADELFFYLVIFFYFIFQTIKFINFAPDIEYGGDAIRYWVYAKDLVFDENTFKNSASLIEVRWGIWIMPFLLIKIFSSDIVFYYLSNFIAFNLGVIFILLSVKRNLDVLSFSFLCFFIAISSELYRFNYQLLPSTFTILTLGLSIFCFLKFMNSKQNIIKKEIYFLLFVFSCFWLYGVKETNLAFIFGFLLLIYFFEKKYIFKFIFYLFLLYVLETIILNLLLENFSILGKLHHLLINTSKMTDYINLSNAYDNFYDRGITQRWYAARQNNVVIYFISFISILYFLNFENKNKVLIVFILLGLSFVILTSFFIISLNPIVIGQPLDSRYTSPYILIAYILVIFFMKDLFNKFIDIKLNFKKTFFNLLAIILIIIFFIAPDINGNRFNFAYGDYRVKNIKDHINFYNNLPKRIENSGCIQSGNGKRLKYSLQMIPNEKRNQNIIRIFNPYNIKKNKDLKFLSINEDNFCPSIINF